MKVQDYITHYENELEKLEQHRFGLVEANKNTAYTDKKINFIQDLIEILNSNNYRKIEMLQEEKSRYNKLIFKIERYFEKVKKVENDRNKIEEETANLFKELKKEVDEVNLL